MNKVEAAQEFVLNVHGRKVGGHYVELGAFHSSEGSNTNILEKDYAWKGVSFEIEADKHLEFTLNRTNPCILGDARKFNFTEYFTQNNFPNQIDFLQVDIDSGYDQYGQPIDPYCSLQGLLAVPLNTYRFSVITFEHDFNMYLKADAQRDAVREIMHSFGYIIAGKHPHEDWFVDPYSLKVSDYKPFFQLEGSY